MYIVLVRKIWNLTDFFMVIVHKVMDTIHRQPLLEV